MTDTTPPQAIWGRHPYWTYAFTAAGLAGLLSWGLVSLAGPAWASPSAAAPAAHAAAPPAPIAAATTSPSGTSPAPPAPTTVPSSLAPTPPSPSPSTGLSADAERRLAALEQRQESVVNSVIEARSKTIDWWLAYLAVFTAVIGLVGLLIPFIIGRKERERLQADLEEVRRMRGEIDSHLQGSRNNLAESNALLAAQRPESKDSPSSLESKEAVDKAVAEVKAAESAAPTDRLRAEALASKSDPEKAYALWQALLRLSPDDAQAAFYCGYWAQTISAQDGRADAAWWRQRAIAHYQRAVELDGRSHGALNNWGLALDAEAQALARANDLPTARSLWQQAGQRYDQALRIKPDKREAAYNWGLALDAEAQALARANDLPTARSLWQQAGQRYDRALRIKPDLHDAAYNWGLALDAEARALVQANDLPTARSLWQQAGQRYADALRIKPDMHDAANNWGSVLLHEARALAQANDLPTARSLWQQAGQRYADALRIKPDKHEAANNWGIALAAEARALAQANDLPTARSLWQQAGQRYADALRIKPDDHEAANNWGIALLREAEAVGDIAEARGLCERARDLLLPFAERRPDVAAYNLACAYARLKNFEASLAWLRRSRDAGGLPDRKHLETDPDLAELRLMPGFEAFLRETFGG